MLDDDLAALYGVQTKVLLQAVRRNVVRFPSDFMLQLTNQEVAALRSQIVTSKPATSRGGRRYPTLAFTEQGVAMLSSVLRSPRAIAINIEIMRAFVRMRRLVAENEEFAQKLSELESKLATHDKAIVDILDALRQLMTPPAPRVSRKIGFV